MRCWATGSGRSANSAGVTQRPAASPHSAATSTRRGRYTAVKCENRWVTAGQFHGRPRRGLRDLHRPCRRGPRAAPGPTDGGLGDPHRSCPRVHAVLHLHCRELPHPPQQPLARAPHHQRPAPRRDRDLHVPGAGGHRPSPSPQRPLRRRAGRARPAARRQRARSALRQPGRAHGGPQLHHRLVEVAGAGRVHQLGREAAHLRERGIGEVEQPRHHPAHVAVHGGHRLPEGNAGHRRGGVGPDPRQGHQAIGRRREFTAMLIPHLPRTLVCIARAGVVPQPAPQPQHLFQVGVRERACIREPLHPAPVVGGHGAGSRLLQHDLRDPHRVGVADPPPRQVPLVRVEPREQSFVDGFHSPVDGRPRRRPFRLMDRRVRADAHSGRAGQCASRPTQSIGPACSTP